MLGFGNANCTMIIPSKLFTLDKLGRRHAAMTQYPCQSDLRVKGTPQIENKRILVVAPVQDPACAFPRLPISLPELLAHLARLKKSIVATFQIPQLFVSP
jgi:hypothetical protein